MPCSSLGGISRASSSDASSSPSRASKVHHSNLPQEYELEKLVQDMGNTPPSWNIHNSPGKWNGVICFQSNQVRSLIWLNLALKGTVNLSALPRSLIHVDLSMNQLGGEIQLEELPPKLSCLNLSLNRFTGSLNLNLLPQSLRDLDLSRNRFSGHVNLQKIPLKLTLLDLSCNKELQGHVNVAKLSPVLCLSTHETMLVCTNS